MNACLRYGVFVLSLEHEAKFSDMDNVQKQRGSIVLHKETRDGADYIRIEYANSQAVALLLAQETGIEMAGNGSAYIASAAFSLSDFYDRYSPHAYIDTAGFTCGIPNPKGNTHCRKAISNCWNKSVTAPRPSKHTVLISATSWNITRDGTSTA